MSGCKAVLNKDWGKRKETSCILCIKRHENSFGISWLFGWLWKRKTCLINSFLSTENITGLEQNWENKTKGFSFLHFPIRPWEVSFSGMKETRTKCWCSSSSKRRTLCVCQVPCRKFTNRPGEAEITISHKVPKINNKTCPFLSLHLLQTEISPPYSAALPSRQHSRFFHFFFLFINNFCTGWIIIV